MDELTNINNAISVSEIGYTDRIRLLREKLELTQEQFADKIGVSTVLISDIEIKKKKLSLSVIKWKKYTITSIREKF